MNFIDCGEKYVTRRCNILSRLPLTMLKNISTNSLKRKKNTLDNCTIYTKISVFFDRVETEGYSILLYIVSYEVKNILYLVNFAICHKICNIRYELPECYRASCFIVAISINRSSARLFVLRSTEQSERVSVL